MSQRDVYRHPEDLRIAVSGITQSLHVPWLRVIRVARDLASPLRHRLLFGTEAIINAAENRRAAVPASDLLASFVPQASEQ